MAFQTGSNKSFTVKAYAGDNKTLLAFNFASADDAKNLAGFTIQCQPPGAQPYFLWNELQFPDPSKHAQVSTEKPQSSVNAPIQKYRWVHVTGVNHQGTSPATGDYIYTVTPRFFDGNQSMLPLDKSLSASLTIAVGAFKKADLSLGFTRGYMQSEAFARHFGKATRIVPANRALEFDTKTQAGTNAANETVTYADIYAWMGSTAREQVFAVLNAVVEDKSLTVKVFAYDLDEPDVVKIFLQLAAQNRIKLILDNASLHIADPKTGKTPLEVPFAQQFAKAAPDAIVQGCFGRFSHDKIFIVSKNGAPVQVLTGSTNWSVTGLYVNANHVLVFNDPAIAAEYSKVFEASWTTLDGKKTPSQTVAAAFAANPLAKPQALQSAGPPKLNVSFSPHTTADATTVLQGLCDRVKKEQTADKGNVLFAVMQLAGTGQNLVYDTLSKLHATQTLYSYGISDAPQGVVLYQPSSKTGVMVTGKPSSVLLPPPFNQVPSPPGHEIHDKFVVCGINGPDPTVYCGSSNLAQGGESLNGDNLLEIHDEDVATAFGIEALLLVDHYNFLDRFATAKKKAATPKAKAVAV